MNQKENNNKNNSSNSLVFGQWPQTKMGVKLSEVKTFSCWSIETAARIPNFLTKTNRNLWSGSNLIRFDPKSIGSRFIFFNFEEIKWSQKSHLGWKETFDQENGKCSPESFRHCTEVKRLPKKVAALGSIPGFDQRFPSCHNSFFLSELPSCYRSFFILPIWYRKEIVQSKFYVPYQFQSRPWNMKLFLLNLRRKFTELLTQGSKWSRIKFMCCKLSIHSVEKSYQSFVVHGPDSFRWNQSKNLLLYFQWWKK